MAAILNLSVTLTLNIKEYYHYLQEHMNSLSKGVILSILGTYNQIMRGKRHNFINFWHFFFFYMAAILYFLVPGPLMIFLRLSHNRASS